MATNYFSASIYRKTTSAGSGTLNPYQTIGFPATGGALLFKPAPSGIVDNGVTSKAIITVLPTGLVVPPGDYYTDSTVAQLITLANT